MRVVFDWSVLSAAAPASAAEVAAAVAAVAAKADGWDNHQARERAMCLCGYGKVLYYLKSSLQRRFDPDGGSQYTNNWGRQLHLKVLSVCWEN